MDEKIKHVSRIGTKMKASERRKSIKREKEQKFEE